jgi:hypothetical protein
VPGAAGCVARNGARRKWLARAGAARGRTARRGPSLAGGLALEWWRRVWPLARHGGIGRQDSRATSGEQRQRWQHPGSAGFR